MRLARRPDSYKASPSSNFLDLPICVAQQRELVQVELFLKAEVLCGADIVVVTQSLQRIALGFYGFQSEVANAVQGRNIRIVIAALQIYAVLQIEREPISEIVRTTRADASSLMASSVRSSLNSRTMGASVSPWSTSVARTTENAVKTTVSR